MEVDAPCAVRSLAVSAMWLLIHVGFDAELARLMPNYVTNSRLVKLACVASALDGEIL